MFIVYADCSSCIATFLYNLKDMEDEEFNSIIVIVPPNTSQLISYYIKQIGSSILDKVSVVEDDNYLEAPLETYNGKVYRIVNGYPDKCWITKQ